MVKIDTTETLFYSQLDEEAFFSWAKKIECVVSIERGVLSIDPEKVNDSRLRELIGLLSRYEAHMAQLSEFASSDNECWFKNKTMFWYDKVFISGTTTKVVVNKESVESFFGYWPKFCDATINKLVVDCHASILKLSLYYIDSDKNRMAEVGLLFSGIEDVELNELREHNVLDELVINSVACPDEGYKVEIEACCGMSGSLSCNSIEVEYINA